MNINAEISNSTSFSGKVLFVLYAADAPNTPVDHLQYDPSPNPIPFTFLDKPWKTYIVNTYDSPGWPSLGTLKLSWIFQKDRDKDILLDPTYIFMDDPYVGTTTYTNAPLFADGREIDHIERVGIGTQFPAFDVDYIENGFELLNDGDTFQQGEKWVIFWKAQTVQADIISPTTGGGGFTKEVLITTDTTVPDDANGTLYYFSGLDQINCVLQLPALASFPDFGIIGVNNFNNLVDILTNGSDKLVSSHRLNGAWIQATERITIMKSGILNQWVITDVSDSMYMTGSILDNYVTTQRGNYLFADGSLKLREDYPRLWAYINANPNCRIDDATWTSTLNKGKFSTGDGSTTFRLPQLYLTGFMRGVDGVTRLPGSYEAAAFPEHTHLMAKNTNSNGPIDADHYLLARKDVAQSNGYILAGTTETPDSLKSGPAGSGTANNPANYGIYKLVCI